jgi:UDP-GlcNAc3NAcA epimerase
MIKILTIIGARPQIIKAAALSRVIRNKFSEKIRETIVHTGQHYDDNMSQIFIDELQVPEPNYNLNVGSDSHAKQTAAMITGIEEIILHEKPSCVVVYGDTNSTLAGAIAASKLRVPIAHIEAGMRSFNKTMPEEINRIMCDHVSTLLFTPTRTGYENLLREGFRGNNKPPYTMDNPKVYHCGDVMYDNSIFFAEVAREKSFVLKKNKLEPGNFVLSTIHRNNNTDDPSRLSSLFASMQRIAEENNIRVVIPLHPRTSKKLTGNLSPELYSKIKTSRLIKILPPVSFLDMIALESNARLIMTDSGGVQKEAFFFQKPCIILRPETEWQELLESGMALIADADIEKINDSYNELLSKKDMKFPPIFGNGKAGEFICAEIAKCFATAPVHSV